MSNIFQIFCQNKVRLKLSLKVSLILPSHQKNPVMESFSPCESDGHPSDNALGMEGCWITLPRTSVTYTWISQVCKICAFSPTKTYQMAENLHILKIQVT